MQTVTSFIPSMSNKEIEALLFGLDEQIEQERVKLKSVKVNTVKKKNSEPKLPKPLYKGLDKAGRLQKCFDKGLYKVLVLETDWESKPEDEFNRLCIGVLDLFKAGLEHAPKKVQDRMTYFVEYVSGKVDAINSFQETAIKILCKEGKIDAKKGGSFQRAMYDYPTHPYRAGTVNSCTASSLKAMQLLKIVIKNERNEWVPNPKSTYLPVLRQKLGC